MGATEVPGPEAVAPPIEAPEAPPEVTDAANPEAGGKVGHGIVLQVEKEM